jgi:thiol-disulfide isomerase/thioredoxin
MTKRRFTGSVILATVFLFALPVAGLQAQDEGIYWYKDLNEAMAAAKQTNRPMMIDFWADWCGPCKIMDADVYPDPEVIAAFREKMIGVRIHFDMQQELARRFGVEGLPYLSFTSSYGTELLRHRGLLEAKDLVAVVNAFPDVTEVNRLDRALLEDEDHFPSLRDMGQQLRAMGFFEASNRFYEKALRRDEAKRDAAQREVILYSIALNSIALKDGKSAAASLERCLKEFPASARLADFRLALGRAYLLDEKTDKAKSALRLLVTEAPESPAAGEARQLLDTL